MKNLLLLAFPILLLTACQPSPEPIEYGSDACDFCKMTIVDAQHGAEAVTSKGKVYKFDAIECLVNFIEQVEAESKSRTGFGKKDKSFAFLLVNDFHSPKELMDATTSHYLISKNLPSPMGAYLTAFKELSAAEEMQKVKGGEVFDWSGMQIYLKGNGFVKTAAISE